MHRLMYSLKTRLQSQRACFKMFSITDRLIDQWHFEQTFRNHSSCKFLSLRKVI